jgi:hypothetical protein
MVDSVGSGVSEQCWFDGGAVLRAAPGRGLVRGADVKPRARLDAARDASRAPREAQSGAAVAAGQEVDLDIGCRRLAALDRVQVDWRGRGLHGVGLGGHGGIR